MKRGKAVTSKQVNRYTGQAGFESGDISTSGRDV
jgi:hypothetical protein